MNVKVKNVQRLRFKNRPSGRETGLRRLDTADGTRDCSFRTERFGPVPTFEGPQTLCHVLAISSDAGQDKFPAHNKDNKPISSPPKAAGVAVLK